MSSKYQSLLVKLAVLSVFSLIISSSAQGFSIPIHMEVTDPPIEELTAIVNGRSMGFSDRAIEQIDEANEGVDSRWTRSAAYFKPERHFTNEDFSGSSQRLINLRQEVIDQVRNEPRDGHTARERLG